MTCCNRPTTTSRCAPWGALLAAATALAPVAAQAQEPCQALRGPLKIATTAPEGMTWTNLLKQAVADVENATDGRVRFKVYPGGVRGDDTVVMRRIRTRELAGALVTSAVFNSTYPDLQVYNLPMAFRSLQEVDAVREALDPVLVDGLRGVGFETFGIAEVGMAYAMSKKEARTVAEGRKLKVWVQSGDVAAERTLTAFGITAVPLTLSDIYFSLEANVIDTVAMPLTAVLPFRLHTKLRYVVDLPLMYIYSLFIISSRPLADVCEADLETMRRVLGAAVAEADAGNRRDLPIIRRTLKNQGLTFLSLTPAEEADWKAHGETAARNWVEEGIIGKPIYRQLAARLAEVRGAPATGPSSGESAHGQ